MLVIDGKRVNDDVALRDFKYYIFDWDDNILHMPTRIHLEKRGVDGVWRPVSVSTTTFTLARTDTRNYRFPRNGGRQAAFRDFKDSPVEASEQKFIRDTRAALARVAAGEKPGPSFETLRKTLREGRLFAIVTARGHESATIRQAVRIFIDEALTAADRTIMLECLRGYRWWLDKRSTFGSDDEEIDYYLSMCRYHAVTSPSFLERLAEDDDFGQRVAEAPSTQRPELAKEYAIRDFTDHLIHTLDRTGGLELRRPMSVGFSDDDPGNVQAVSDYIRAELARRYGAVKFVVYDTSDAALTKGRKVTVAGQLDLPGF